MCVCFLQTILASEYMSTEHAPVEVGYKPKSSFFDSISCETLDRQKAREERVSHSVRREQDMETFGETFGRSGGGHRGHRGNSRGGGGKGKGGGNQGGGKGGNRDGDGGNRRRRGGKGKGNNSGDRKSEGEWRTVGK